MSEINRLKAKLEALLSLGGNPQLDVLENYYLDFAKELFLENCLNVNGHKIFIRDIELSFDGFYSDKIKGHADQLELGRLFFHKKDKYMSPKMIGVDITAGNWKKHGTIFIRAIEADGKKIEKPNAVFWYIMELFGYRKHFEGKVDEKILKIYDGMDLFSEASSIKFEPCKSFANVAIGHKEKMVNKDLPDANLRAYISYLDDSEIQNTVESATLHNAPEVHFDSVKNIKVKEYSLSSPAPQDNSNFKMAQTRYRSILDRSFDKDLDAFLYIQEVKKEQNDFTQFCFPANSEQLTKRATIYTVIESEYDNVKTLRSKNKIINLWQDKNKDLIKEYKKKYREIFSQRLSFENFCTFFKNDDSVEYRKCVYCQLSEKDASNLFEKEMIYTKRKYSRGRSMEVDKIDPNGLYEVNNISLCCYWCNNAKTDEFDEKEFKEIGIVISRIWQKRLQKT